jgi:pimeloyl-ACP methyl ester carboxylesterase
MLAQQDRRARGVILCASFIRPPHPLLEWCRFAATAPVISVIRIGRRVPLFFSSRPHDEVRRHKAETLARVSSRTLAARVRAILALDARDALARSEVPIVYLASSRDTVVPRRNADDVVRERPSARLVTIEGAHMALYTNPHAAAEEICRVLRVEDVSAET